MPTSSSATRPETAAEAIAAQKLSLAQALLSEAAPGPRTQSLSRLHDAARARLLDLGAPVKRDEYWKFTDPSALTQPRALVTAGDGAPARDDAFAGLEPLRLSFVDGAFREDLSDSLALVGAEITPLSTLSSSPASLGDLELAAHETAPRPLSALNGALASDGAVIRVTGEVARPLLLDASASSRGAGYLRHWISLAPGASATLLEIGASGAAHNAVIEADLGAGARLSHVRLQRGKAAEAIATALFARLGAACELKSFSLSAASAALIRNETVIWLEGDGARAHLGGGALGAGGQVIDNTVFLSHGALGGESRQVFKSVLADRAEGVFQGKILVREGAQQTDGYQLSQSALLDERARFSAKPELEIYADDVKCSHGSTSGAVDEAALFYLRSRGVEAHLAQAMLVAAFLEEAIGEIEEEAVRRIMRDETARWMAARRG